MAETPISLIDGAMPAQGEDLLEEGEVIEIEELEDPTEIIEEEDGSVVINFEDSIKEELLRGRQIWPTGVGRCLL